MTRTGCDRETELLQAMRVGALPEATRTHLLECAACRQTHAASRLLLLYAEQVGRSAEAPAAARVWRRALQRRQEAALRRASVTMSAMCVAAAVYVFAVLVWALRLTWLRQPEHGRQMLHALSGGTVAAGVGAALMLLIVGAATLMVAGQRPPLRILH